MVKMGKRRAVPSCASSISSSSSKGGGNASATTRPLHPNDLFRLEKIDTITKTLEKKDVDLWKLRELCLTNGGLINGRFP